jgi:hypothetical protein
VTSVQAKFCDSPCWKALLKEKEIYMKGRKVTLKNGELVRFWNDPWLNGVALCDSFSILLDLCQKQDNTIKQFSDMHFNLPLRRRLRGEILTQWDDILVAFHGLDLSDTPDTVSWSLGKHTEFSTKLVYQYLEKRYLWSA